MGGQLDPMLAMKYYKCQEKLEAHEAEAKKRDDAEVRKNAAAEMATAVGAQLSQFFGSSTTSSTASGSGGNPMEPQTQKEKRADRWGLTRKALTRALQRNDSNTTNTSDTEGEHGEKEKDAGLQFMKRFLGNPFAKKSGGTKTGASSSSMQRGRMKKTRFTADASRGRSKSKKKRSKKSKNRKRSSSSAQSSSTSEHEKRRKSKRSRSNRSNSIRALRVPGEENKLRYDQKAYEELKRALDPNLDVANCDSHEKWVEALAECTNCSKVDELLEAQGLSKQLSHSKKSEIGQLLEHIAKK